MSTKTQATQAIQFDPTSMGVFQQGVPAAGKFLQNLLTSDPTASPYYRTMLGATNQQAFGLGQGMFSNLWRNQLAGAGGAASLLPFQQQMLASTGRNVSSLRAQGFRQAMQNMMGLQMGAAGQMMGFRPLQTGGTTTQTMSGLGTWLPQVLGAGLSLGLGLPGMLGGGGGAGLASLPVAGSSPWSNPSLVGMSGVPGGAPSWSGIQSGSMPFAPMGYS